MLYRDAEVSDDIDQVGLNPGPIPAPGPRDGSTLSKLPSGKKILSDPTPYFRERWIVIDQVDCKGATLEMGKVPKSELLLVMPV